MRLSTYIRAILVAASASVCALVILGTAITPAVHASPAAQDSSAPAPGPASPAFVPFCLQGSIAWPSFFDTLIVQTHQQDVTVCVSADGALTGDITLVYEFDDARLFGNLMSEPVCVVRIRSLGHFTGSVDPSSVGPGRSWQAQIEGDWQAVPQGVVAGCEKTHHEADSDPLVGEIRINQGTSDWSGQLVDRSVESSFGSQPFQLSGSGGSGAQSVDGVTTPTATPAVASSPPPAASPVAVGPAASPVAGPAGRVPAVASPAPGGAAVVTGPPSESMGTDDSPPQGDSGLGGLLPIGPPPDPALAAAAAAAALLPMAAAQAAAALAGAAGAPAGTPGASSPPLTASDAPDFTPWQPGAWTGTDGSQGQPGQVWDSVRKTWVAPGDLQAAIDKQAAIYAANEVETRKRVRAGEQGGEDWGAQASARGAREEAAIAEAKRQQDEARASLARIEDSALKRGLGSVLDSIEDHAINPDGTLNTEYVERLKEILRRQIGLDQVAPTPDYSDPSWLREATEQTWEDARKSTGIRIGLGVLSGGSSEIYYQGQDAYDAMRESFEKAAEKGQEWGITDALRAGYGNLAENNLPINTVKTLVEGKTSVWDVGTSLVSDLMAGLDVVETGRNIQASGKALSEGAGLWNAAKVQADPIKLFGGSKPSDPSQWPVNPGEHGGLRTPQPIRGMPEGAPAHPADFGVTQSSARQAQVVADKYGVGVSVRPIEPGAMARRIEGDLPKPPFIKSNTVGPLDEKFLGAPPNSSNRAAVWNPTDPKAHPDFKTLPPKDQESLLTRFDGRLKDHQHLKEIRETLPKGWTVTEDGLFRGPGGKPVTGDHDIFDIYARDPQGKKVPVPDSVKEAVLRDLGSHRGWRDGLDSGISNGTFDAQHGGHADWRRLAEADQLKVTGIDQRIVTTHQPGGQPLLGIEAGRPPSATYTDIAPDQLDAHRQQLATLDAQRNELHESLRARGKESLLEQAAARREQILAGGGHVPAGPLEATHGVDREATSTSLWWHTTPEERTWQDQLAQVVGNTVRYSDQDPVPVSTT